VIFSEIIETKTPVFGVGKEWRYRFFWVGAKRRSSETFEKCSSLFKFKEGEDFNPRHTLGISRIEI